jgi:TetR/AcrR family tetracycline transcriptional repressor
MSSENRAPSPKGTAQLSRERILDAALALVDEHGHDKLTMRALARQLGVDPMAPYHYVPNKAALLDGLVERVWSAISFEALDVDSAASDQLVHAFSAVYRGLVNHPNLLPVVATRSIATPHALALAERALELLERSIGVTPAEGMQVVNSLAALTIGRALAEAAPAAGGQSLAEVLELAQQFPRLATASTSSRDPGTAPLERALRGIIAAWSSSA